MPAGTKRRSSVSGAETSSKKSMQSEQYISLFGRLTKEAGLILSVKDVPHELSVDQTAFQRSLLLSIKKAGDTQKIVDEYMDGFSIYIEDPLMLYWSMMPTITSSGCDSARSGSQDSLLRLLLGIDCLQLPLSSLVLEKIAELDTSEVIIPGHPDRVNLPRLILNQLRWLDHIVDSRGLASKMLEIAGLSPLDVQREIVACLPEVVDDGDHQFVSQELRDLLSHNTQLTVVVLDALSNLCLKPELLTEVRASVMQSLASFDVEDLPVVVKFLLQTASTNDYFEVVQELRSRLEFHHISLPPISSSTPSGAKKSKGGQSATRNRSTECLVVDAIHAAVRFHKAMADAWIKVLEAVQTASEHKVLDIIVLFVLHFSGRRKPIESLIRNKIRAGHLSEVLMQAVLGSHTGVLGEYFPSILSLSEKFLRSPEPAVSAIGAAMYKTAFLSFDAYYQQEIIGSLVVHIGGFEGEVDSSLDVLLDLVQTNTSALGQFAIFIKGVLDYLDNMSLSQIRKLYSVLSSLAFRGDNDESLIQDDMHILIRKQLSNSSPRYKRMGVIGALMVVDSLAGIRSGTGQSTSSADDSALSQQSYKQVIQLLQLVKQCSVSCPEVLALFMDELANIVRKGQLDAQIQAWISENVISNFQEDYVVDIEPIKDTTTLLPMAYNYGLDDETESTIAINLMPLVLDSLKSSNVKKESRVSPVCLAPQFRLLSSCELVQNNGDLESIDALLGCAVLSFREEILAKVESLSRQEREAACTTMFYMINWFREVVNGFASQSNSEMKAKVISRLHNVTDIHGYLEKCLAATPNFSPPPANFVCEFTPPVSAPPSGQQRSKKGKKVAAKSAKNKTDLSSTANDVYQFSSQATTQSTQKNSIAVSVEKAINLEAYRPFFRELDIGVFSALETGSISRAVLDTEMNIKAVTPIKLQSPQLMFLLEDLVLKLQHALPATVCKRKTFLKTRNSKTVGFTQLDQHSSAQLAEWAVTVLPSLCDRLLETNDYFKARLEEDDGVIDGPSVSSADYHQMVCLFHLLLQAISHILSWNGFERPDNRGLFRQCVSVMAARIEEADTSQLLLKVLFKKSFEYMLSFTTFLPSISAAVVLVKILVLLAEKSGSSQLKSNIASLTEQMLKREWTASDGQQEKGAKYNEALQCLFKYYLQYSDDKLEVIENMLAVDVQELLKGDKNASSITFKTLTRASFIVFYRASLTALISCAQEIAPGRSTDTSDVKTEKLLQWALAVRIFHILVNLIKAFEQRVNLNAILKYGRQFVEVFLRQGMPLLDYSLRDHREEVTSLLKNLQLSTRFLHHMCGHSKIIKDISLTNQVPLLKKCLESFVYRVKAMLTLNKCLDAFWLGNLKNRDLQGEEILSQASTTTNDPDESDQEELPEDDDDQSDVEVDGESNDSTSDKSKPEESYSECY